MAKPLPDDILLPSGLADQRPLTSRVAAFVPIMVAVAGVAAILLGGVRAHQTVAEDSSGIDPMVTGSISAVPLAAEGNMNVR